MRTAEMWARCLLSVALLGIPVAASNQDGGVVAASGLVASAVIGVRGDGLQTGAAARSSADQEDRAPWAWPLRGFPEIVRGFDPPAQRWLRGHRGIDLGGVEGEDVLAVESGVVSFSGSVAGVGVLSITHPNGVRSTYQPVTGVVPRGTRVARGERVASLDGVGNHCPGCLHLGAVRGRDQYLDPTPWLLGVELTLLPLG